MSIAHIALLLLATFLASESVADPRYLMPRHLVEYARGLGCMQVEDFFDGEGVVGAPFVYGYLPGRQEQSAAFWCQKVKDTKRNFFLVIWAERGAVEGPLACPRMIPWHNYPGGLDIYRDADESLDQFSRLDSPQVRGPRDARVIHNAIRSNKPGQSTTFYCHEGNWLVRFLH